MTTKNPTNPVPAVRSVRELGGEISAELSNRFSAGQIEWRLKEDIVDVIMGVLARYDGARIQNDPDLPVELLPSV